MAAMIEFVCIAEHGRRDDPTVTLEQRAWAFCAAGASEDHKWVRIDPTRVETVRSRPGNGLSHLVPEEIDKRALADGPAR